MQIISPNSEASYDYKAFFSQKSDKHRVLNFINLYIYKKMYGTVIPIVSLNMYVYKRINLHSYADTIL